MDYKKEPGTIWEWFVYAFAWIMRNCLPKLSVKYFTKRTNPYALWFLPCDKKNPDGFYPTQLSIAKDYSGEKLAKRLWSPVVIGEILCKQPEKLAEMLQCPNTDYAWFIRSAYEYLTDRHRSPKFAIPLLEIVLPKMTDTNLKMTDDDCKNWIEVACDAFSRLDFPHGQVMSFLWGREHSSLNRRYNLFKELLYNEECLEALKSNPNWKKLRDYLVKTVWASMHIKKILSSLDDLTDKEKESLQQRLVDYKIHFLKTMIECLRNWDKAGINAKIVYLYNLGLHENMEEKAMDAKWAQLRQLFVNINPSINADTIEGIVENAIRRSWDENVNAMSKDNLVRYIVERRKSAVNYFPKKMMRDILASWVREKVKELVEKVQGLAIANELYPSMREYMKALYGGGSMEVSKPVHDLITLTVFESPERLWSYVQEYLRYYFVAYEKKEETKCYFDNRVAYFMSTEVPNLLQTEVAGYLSDEQIEIMWSEHYSTLSDEEITSYQKKLSDEKLFKICVKI